MKKVLYKLKTRIRYSKIGEKIVDCILVSKYSDLIYYLFDKLKLTDGTNRNFINNESCKFFETNKEKIEKIKYSLSDEKSKQVYEKMIKYRCFGQRNNLPEYSLNDQYFPKDIIKLSENEVFVDCGAYIGDTIKRFIRIVNGKYNKIVAFDADIRNLQKIKDKKLRNVTCFNLGVWNKKGILKFVQNNVHSAGSKIKEIATISIFNNIDYQNKKINDTVINVEAIDNIEECSNMTFLKMDIEGAELNALKGAEKTIRKNKPKLAICIYHSDEDMINIPQWIVNLNMDYKLYIRQHLGGLEETVIYAV